MPSESSLRQQLIHTHQKLYTLGFGIANDGNSCVRLTKDKLLITPAGLDKAKLKSPDFVIINSQGKKLKGKQAPSSEFQMHVHVMNARPDVMACVHTHAPYAITLSLAGISLHDAYLPEVTIALGRVPTVAYATTGTEMLATKVADAMKHANVAILERHGVIALGATLTEALSRIERLEHAAKILVNAFMIKPSSPLPAAEEATLLRLGRTLGYHTSV